MNLQPVSSQYLTYIGQITTDGNEEASIKSNVEALLNAEASHISSTGQVSGAADPHTHDHCRRGFLTAMT